MMDVALIAAWIGPIIATMAALGGLYAWLSNRREKTITGMVNDAVTQLDGRLTQVITSLNTRLTVVEEQLAAQTRQLDKQDTALARAVESIARIEGRLMKDSTGG